MTKENIFSELTEEAYDQIAEIIRVFDSLLTFAINLKPSERHSLQKMGDKTRAFVEKAIQYANERPELVPNYLDMKQFQKDFKLATQLKELQNMLEPALEKISDTYLAAGSTAFDAARKFYSYVKTASDAGAPGSDAVALELGKRFMRKKAKTSDNQKTPVVSRENQEDSTVT